MAGFKRYIKSSTPAGLTLIVLSILYFILLGVSNDYRSQDKSLGSLGPDTQYFLLVILSIPLILWPLTSNNEFIKDNLPPFFISNPGEPFVKRVLKRWSGGYIAALIYPFMRIREIYFKNFSSPELLTYKYENYFNYAFMPFAGFVCAIVAIGIAVYFNENVINATNEAGIYYVGPGDRTIYQIIFSLLLLTIFFAFVPNQMTTTLDKNWNYYLIFLFAIINLILVDRQLYKKNLYGQPVLWSIYGISIALMLYALYNFVYTADQSKDFRILSLGRLNDEDRININQNMFLSYNALRMLLDGGEKYFQGDGRFDVNKLGPEEKNRINPNVIRELQGQTKTGVRELMKRVDSTLIKIYEARLNWEKSVRTYFKERDGNVLDGFFSSRIYQSLYDISIVREDAQKLYDDWQKSRAVNQLPNGELTQRVFGTGVGLALGNIAISAVSAQALNSFSKSIDKNLRVLVNRYVFFKLADKLSIIDDKFNNLVIGGGIEELSTLETSPDYNDEKVFEKIEKIAQGFKILCELLYYIDMNYNYNDKLKKYNNFVQYIEQNYLPASGPLLNLNQTIIDYFQGNDILISKAARETFSSQLELIKDTLNDLVVKLLENDSKMGGIRT